MWFVIDTNLRSFVEIVRPSKAVILKTNRVKATIFRASFLSNIPIIIALIFLALSFFDFERKDISVPLATIRQLEWINYDDDLFSTSLDINRPIHGNNFLRVDLTRR